MNECSMKNEFAVQALTTEYGPSILKRRNLTEKISIFFRFSHCKKKKESKLASKLIRRLKVLKEWMINSSEGGRVGEGDGQG